MKLKLIPAMLGIGCFMLFVQAWSQTTAPSLSGSPPQPDVRLLIDVSGSMKNNDPQNLRRPAVNLLVKLLPRDSKGGIWTFGNDVKTLVPHGNVTDRWRQQAEDAAGSIDSRALFTQIGQALETAAAAGAPHGDYRTSLVLLTDGVVDIDNNAAANHNERRRILETLLPQLKNSGFVVHTIALSENADQDLLLKLAVSTGGLAAVAGNAEELMSVFLQILDVAAPTEKVSIEGNRFLIDATIEEFTALIFSQPGGRGIRLQNPAGEFLSLAQAEGNDHISWYRGSGSGLRSESGSYDLVTVTEPMAGQWLVQADMEPDSRITVVSNLNLRVGELPVNVYRGQSLPVAFVLQEDGKTIARSEFLSLMTFKLQLRHRLGDQEYQPVWQTVLPVEDEALPASGIFHVRLPEFDSTGDYLLRISVDGKSFQRESSHRFAVRTPFAAEVVGARDAQGSSYYVLTLRSSSPDIDNSKTQVVATLTNPNGRKTIRPMALDDTAQWRVKIKPSDTGRYNMAVTITGDDTQGAHFSYRLDDLGFYYSPERGLIDETDAESPVLVEVPEQPQAGGQPGQTQPDEERPAEPLLAEPLLAEETAPGLSAPGASASHTETVPAPAPAQAEPLPGEPEADQAGANEQAPDTEVSKPETEGSAGWLSYSGMILGNLLLLGLLVWGYRKLFGNNPDPDEILAEFSDETIDGDTPVQPDAAETASEPSSTSVSPAQAQLADDPELDAALASIMGDAVPPDAEDDEKPNT